MLKPRGLFHAGEDLDKALELLMDARIVVIGASIGGLAAAAGLGRRGARCVVVERANRLPEAGGGIQIAQNSAAVLHRLGLAGALAGAVRPAAGSCAAGRTTR